jgi:hypothetical protein
MLPEVLQRNNMPQALGKAIDTRKKAQPSDVHSLKLSKSLRDEFVRADNIYPSPAA